jgi:hypothetical protein
MDANQVHCRSMSYMTTRKNINVYSVAVRNTQQIYISRSSKDIQVQYDMHLQEALILAARDEEFIAREKTSRSSKGIS